MREIQSLARGLQILDLIVNSKTPKSVTEIAKLLDVDKSTASRLVGTLENYGYVQQAKGTRAYSTGKRIHTIGWQVSNQYALSDLAKPYLEYLVQQTKECSHIGVYSSGYALVTDDVQSESSILRVVGSSGRLIPLHNTAIGKGLIAFGDFPLPTDFPQITEKTITSLETLENELEVVRQQGFAVDDEENEYGVCCIASPIFNTVGVTVASIGISGPTVRVFGERITSLGQIVKETAYRLSCELGFDGDYPL